MLVQTTAACGANLIVTGAGLPLTLPMYTTDYPDVALVPSISNLLSAQIICETWQNQYNRLPDALIVKNCQMVGGHFTQCENIGSPEFSIESLISRCEIIWNNRWVSKFR